MSNRNEADITFAAELKAAHLAQIEALTAPGLTDGERAERFMAAARFDATEYGLVHDIRLSKRYAVLGGRAAYAVWCIGSARYSLFGDMPGCGCPVYEVADGREISGVPARIPYNWDPTADDLLPFARVQQERRLG